MIRADSYGRVSSKRQEHGDGMRRQEGLRDRWLTGRPDVELVRVWRDVGVSAWKGRNLTDGELGDYIKELNAGGVPRGSILIVESLDRVSRDELLGALTVILGILNRGIRIVTLIDGMEFCATDSPEKTMLSLLISLVILSRASNESAAKSARGLENWSKKRADAVTDKKVLTRMTKAWLRCGEDGIEVIPEHGETVRRIFKLAETHGSAAIVRKLNEEDRVPPSTSRRQDGGKWSTAYVRLILSDPAVVGVFRPGKRGENGRQQQTGDEVADYYPAVISADQWTRTQAAQVMRRVSGGQIREQTTGANLFAGLCRCLSCRGPMVIQRAKRGGPYIRCLNRYRYRTCETGRTYSYPRFEGAGLEAIAREMRTGVARSSTELDATNAEVASLTISLERETAALARLLDVFSEGDDEPVILQKIEARRAAVGKLRAQMAEAEKARLLAAAKMPKVGGAAEFGARLAALEAGDENVRADMAAAVRKIVSAVGFTPNGKIIVEVANSLFFAVSQNYKVEWSAAMEATSHGGKAQLTISEMEVWDSADPRTDDEIRADVMRHVLAMCGVGEGDPDGRKRQAVEAACKVHA